MDTCIFLGSNMILDGYFVKPGPPPLAHPSDVERFESKLAIYQWLSSHERILRCHGLHPTEKALRRDYLPNGDLGCYLARTGIDNISYSTCLQWIVDVAEGITFLHSKGVVWVDVTPSNMLLTDNLRIVLSDFKGSSMPPKFFSSIQPTSVWVAPPNTWRECPFFVETQDRFAFGTLVFVLLLGCYPHCDGPSYSSYDEQFRIEDLHEAGIFDHWVSNEAYPVLTQVTQKCWRVEYESTEAMLHNAIRSRDEYLKVCESSAVMQNDSKLWWGSVKGTSSMVGFDCMLMILEPKLRRSDRVQMILMVIIGQKSTMKLILQLLSVRGVAMGWLNIVSQCHCSAFGTVSTEPGEAKPSRDSIQLSVTRKTTTAPNCSR